MPQDQGCIGEAKDPRLYAVEEHMGVVALSVIQGQALLQVRLGRAELTQMEKGAAQCPICLHEQGRVVLLLGQAQELLPQLARREKLAPHTDETSAAQRGPGRAGGSPRAAGTAPGRGYR